MNFPLLVRAETVKLFSRLSARLGLIVAATLGVATPLLLGWVAGGFVVSTNGGPPEALLDPDTTTAFTAALYARNLFFTRAFLVVLAAQSSAGERTARTLREDLLRPVRREAVLLAKWTALLAWDAVALALTFVTVAAVGAVALGTTAAWTSVLAAFATNLACDAGVVALALAVGLLTRSTVGTLAGLLVGLMLDQLLGWSLAAVVFLRDLHAAFIQPAQTASWLLPALPSEAFGLWSAALPTGQLDVRSVGALVALTIASLAVAALRLRQDDLP